MAKGTAQIQLVPLESASHQCPSVFDFENYRDFLKAWLAFRKENQATYSGALFAKRAGLQSHSLLGMVIRGDRNLTYETIRSFSRGLELTSAESLYFEKLVLFNQAKHPEDQSFYLEQLLTVSKGRSQNVFSRLHDFSEFLSHWYIVAIKELMEVKDFRFDPSWIASKLQGRVTKQQVEEALALLERLGFIKRNSKREAFEVQKSAIDIDPKRVSFAIRSFHKECLRIVLESMDSDPIERRQISSVTLAVSGSDVEIMKRRVGSFIKELANEFPSKQNSNLTDVVQVSGLVIQLTEPSASSHRKEIEK